MVVSDVDEVVGTGTEGGDGDGASAVEQTNRFDRIKESYKGVTTALDLSEETSAYEDFASLLGDHKVGKTRFPRSRPRYPRLYQAVLHFFHLFLAFLGPGACESPVSLR